MAVLHIFCYNYALKKGIRIVYPRVDFFVVHRRIRGLIGPIFFSYKIPEFFKNSPLSGAGKHPDFQ